MRVRETLACTQNRISAYIYYLYAIVTVFLERSGMDFYSHNSSTAKNPI